MTGAEKVVLSFTARHNPLAELLLEIHKEIWGQSHRHWITYSKLLLHTWMCVYLHTCVHCVSSSTRSWDDDQPQSLKQTKKQQTNCTGLHFLTKLWDNLYNWSPYTKIPVWLHSFVQDFQYFPCSLAGLAFHTMAILMLTKNFACTISKHTCGLWKKQMHLARVKCHVSKH